MSCHARHLSSGMARPTILSIWYKIPQIPLCVCHCSVKVAHGPVSSCIHSFWPCQPVEEPKIGGERCSPNRDSLCAWTFKCHVCVPSTPESFEQGAQNQGTVPQSQVPCELACWKSMLAAQPSFTQAFQRSRQGIWEQEQLPSLGLFVCWCIQRKL